jgi:hypothetical protein
MDKFQKAGFYSILKSMIDTQGLIVDHCMISLCFGNAIWLWHRAVRKLL